MKKQTAAGPHSRRRPSSSRTIAEQPTPSRADEDPRASQEFGAADTSRSSDVSLAARLFAEIADGRFQSGEELAHRLGVSRSGVWKAANALRELGATIHAVRNRGYRLAVPAEPLDPDRIRATMGKGMRSRIRSLDVTWSTDSTNTELLNRANLRPGVSEVLLAEHQTAGRGRRGRAWLAPPGGAICLSLSWTFPQVPRDLGALSLVIGVCVLRALTAQGVQGARLKWPNDVLFDGRKLGGILIELRAEAAGPTYVVVGIGLNVALGAPLLRQIQDMGLPAIDLRTASSQPISRNAMAASLVEACLHGLAEFEREGFKPFLEEWQEADALRGQVVNVISAEGDAQGLARGIDASGALLVETPQGLRKFISGEVTVRPAP